MKRLLYVLAFILLTNRAISSVVNIVGDAEEYRNSTIEFYTYSDLITRVEVKLANADVDANGHFECSFDLPETSEIFAYLGIYKAFMFAEPGKHYEVVLPPRVDKTLAQQVSLVFEYEYISIGIKGGDEHELNYMIHEFNSIYEDFLSENFTALYISGRRQPVDSIENVLNKTFSYVGNEYFNVYKKYRIAMLRHFVTERDKNTVTRKYLLNQPFYYKNVAYMEFVQNVWNGYFASETSSNDELYGAVIYGKSPKMVKEFFGKNIALRNDTLKELVLLQGIHEALLEHNKFPYRPLFQTLDSINILSKVDEHRTMAKNIKQRHTFVREGDKAPSFALRGADGQTVSLDSLKGKYVYLQFCRSENFECLKDYRMMEQFYDNFTDELQIVTLSFDLDYSTFTSFCNTNKQYGWQFLYASNNQDLLRSYNVKSFPTYFLIDDTGKLLKIPADSPHENFTYNFTQMINWRRRVEEIESRNRDE